MNLVRNGFDHDIDTRQERTLEDNEIITGDEVTFHNGKQIILPEGLTYGKAKGILQRMQDEAETVFAQFRIYDYRPLDGAVAASRVMHRMFGITIGVETPGSFFRPPQPPETKTVHIGPNETVEVPWGIVSVPAFEDTEIRITGMHHSEKGELFVARIETRKKNSKMVAEFLDAIEKELETGSIYRGKAIVGIDEPEFLNLNSIVPSEIVFSSAVMNTLDGTLWSVIRHSAILKSEGVRIKRALLLHGPFGTGKTSAGLLTALEAVAHGWTFIAARPGKDDINEVLSTAKLYAPAVVFIEDVDNQTSTSDSDEVAQVLETFDGVTSKGTEIALLMTTNHFERIHKGMLRPGRIDAVVEVAGLDRAGVERLIRSVVKPERLAPNVDFDDVYDAMSVTVDGERINFFPAYIREALERAKTFAVSRLDGDVNYVLSTEDLTNAATSLYGQLIAQHIASEGEKPNELDEVLSDVIQRVIDRTKMVDTDGSDYTPYKLRVGKDSRS